MQGKATHLLPAAMRDAKRLGAMRAAAVVALLVRESRVALQPVDCGLQPRDNLGPVVVLTRLLERAAHKDGNNPPVVVENCDGSPAHRVSRQQGAAR